MKTCTKCGKEYPATVEYFHRSNHAKCGLVPTCKSCRRQWAKDRYAKDEDFRKRCHEEHLRRMEDPAYRERRNAHAREKWNSDPEYRRRHRERRLERFASNPEVVERQRTYMREWGREKYQTDVNRKLSSLMARQVRYAIGRDKAGLRWESFVGYDLEALKAHLEAQFTKGMTWENLGEWHIDHIRPKSHFQFESFDDPEFKACWSLWNLQPMWAKENFSKHARCDEPPLPLI